MISTVTPNIIYSNAALNLGGSFTLIGILVLLTLLIEKELANGSMSAWAERLRRTADVGIMPLLSVFVLSVIIKVAEVLR